MIAVGAVDDHPLLLLGIRAVLQGEPDIAFVGTAATVPELLATTGDLDVVLLDLRLQDGSRPAQNVRALLAAGPAVVVHTAGLNLVEAKDALAAGALTVVHKNADPTELLRAIREAAQGIALPTREMAQALEVDERIAPALSEREREALRLYATNLPAKSVARRMGVSEGTVKVYLRRVRQKYAALDRRADSKLDLYRLAVEDGLIDPSEPG
ncbi:MAG: LuxR C-terminal-related transcriptional regulator [Actinomycetales bacterium]